MLGVSASAGSVSVVAGIMREVLDQFCPASSTEPQLTALSGGNINDTWLVRTNREANREAFILQRLNSQVFPFPELVVANLATLSRHLIGKGLDPDSRWKKSVLVPTLAGEPLYMDDNGQTWRAITYIEQTRTHAQIRTSAQAWQVGWALGHFHHLLADLPAVHLYESLPGFHVLPLYLDHFDQVVCGPLRAAKSGNAVVRFCRDFVAARRAGAGVLEQARRQGRIGIRVIHGDPKAANVLFDAVSDQAVSLIDLDTVGPGLVLYDIGDCLRSCCNTAGEAASDPAQVHFDMDLCRAVLDGYLSVVGAELSIVDRSLMYSAVRLIAFELGLRFFTDYLAGNDYFKVSHEEENLHRALVQFHLVLSIERNREQIEKLVSLSARSLYQR